MSSRRRLTLWTAAIGTMAALAVAALSLRAFGTDADGWQMAARHTARLSFFLLLTAYLIGPAAALAPSRFTAALKLERRGFGLAFAGAHFVHLGALVMFLQVSGDAASLPTLVVGGLGYVLIALMAATSNDVSVRALGLANWRRLHAFALHYAWLVFVITYARRIASYPDKPEYVVLLACAFAALAIRLAAPRSSTAAVANSPLDADEGALNARQ
jgi:sulfoxide reductase heme-binding subunit YedZ